MADMNAIVNAVLASECFKAEVAYTARGGYEVERTPRLYKELEDGLVRVVFPTTVSEIEEGTVVCVTTLYDLKKRENIYGHVICAGAGVNTLLRTIHAPLGQAKPQPGIAGDKAILRFVAWKQAAWNKFLVDDLELGTAEASRVWLRSFWKAMDRMFGGNVLVNYT